MQSGFNTNIRHRGVLFHVQTEDSGIANPHVITHLFQGGNIMASEKSDYSDQVSDGDLESVVRELMEAQHREMLEGLRANAHDAVILERLGADVFDEDETGSADLGDTAATQAPEVAAQRGARAQAAGIGGGPPQSRSARIFGEKVISARPLDEVVLDYLADSAHKRKRSAK